LDINSLVNVSRLSNRWKLLSEDQSIWRHLFVQTGWAYDTQEIDHYLAYPEKRSLLKRTNIPSSSYTIARTNDTVYDPTLLPTMPGAPARLKPFKKTGDLFFSKLRARQTVPASSASATLKPTLVFSSKSQPILSSTHVVERPFLNRPSPRRHVKYDETAQYHYIESHDKRFINWKRLYQNRRMIERRWQNGKYKTKSFPAEDHMEDMHQGAIYCLQFNNSILVSGSRDRNLKVWNMRTGACQYTLQGHSGSVLCLQFNNRYLISGSSDANLIIWDISTGERLRTLKGHNESVLNVKFSDDTIVSCSKDRTVRIWNLHTGELEQTLVGHRAAVNAVQFKGNRIVSASGDRTIKIWNRVSLAL
jgi:WD40 repeat protein